MELADHSLYLECQKNTGKMGLKQLLASLASQEKEHAKKIQELLSSLDTDDIFDKFNAQAFSMSDYMTNKKLDPTMNYNDLLTAIIEKEEKACALYSFLSTSTSASEVSFLFSTLAFEEQKHKSWAVDRYELEMLASL